MQWLEKLRAKPKEKKVQLLWLTTVVAAIVLIGAWILIGNYDSGSPKNLELFKTIQNSIKNFKMDKTQLTPASGQNQ